MTAPVYVTASAPGGAPAPTGSDEPGCPACPHPLSAHDPIGLRFCRATAGGTVTRGCVCRTA
jgi:hypothetical protein